MMKSFPAVIGTLALAGIATAAHAETDMEKALAEGATRMTSDQIAERLAGKTVTFENASSGALALVYYDGSNGTLIKPEGADEAVEGFYATTLSDHICLGLSGDEPMRLRCVNVLLIDGTMHKFEMDGSLRGRVIEEVEGNLT